MTGSESAAQRVSATERLERLLAMVPWIAGHPDGAPIDEVCDRFGVTPTELVKDLEVVMMVGVHPFTPDMLIDAWVDDDLVIIRYAEAFRRPLRLTASEAVGLVAAASAVRSIPGADRDGPLHRAVTKLAGVLGADQGPGLDVDLGDASAEIFGLLDEARRARRQIDIDYADPGEETHRHRRIEPAHLFSAAGNWYVSGWCHRAAENRLFRVDRILQARPTEDPFDRPGGAGDTEVNFDEELPRIRLRVDRSSAWIIDPVPVLTRVDGEDASEIELAVGSRRWMGRLLLRLGPAATVVEADPRLDAMLLAKNEAEAIRARYR